MERYASPLPEQTRPLRQDAPRQLPRFHGARPGRGLRLSIVSMAGMPKGRAPGRPSIPGAFCKACRRWRSWSIIPKPLKTQIHSDQRVGPSGFNVLGLF
jgi:hypothetical protein